MSAKHNSQNVKNTTKDKVILFTIITIILSVCAFYVTKMSKAKTVSVDCEVISVDKHVETIMRNNRQKHEYIYQAECNHRFNNQQYIVKFKEYHPVEIGEILRINVDPNNPTERKERGVYIFLLIFLNIVLVALIARVIYIFIEEKRQKQLNIH